MASYAARLTELIRVIDDFCGWSTTANLETDPLGFASSSVGKTMSPQQVSQAADEERRQFRNQVPSYFVARNGRLDELSRALDAILSGESDPEGRWGRVLGDLTSDGDRILDGLLSGITEPTRRAASLKQHLLDTEGEFVDKLSAKRVASRWAQMSQIHQDLLVFMGGLRAKWQSLIDKLREIDGQAGPCVDEMLRPFNYAKSQSTDRASRITEGLRRAESQLAELTKATPTGILDKVAATTIATSWLDGTARGLQPVADTVRDTILRNLTLEAEDWEKVYQNFLTRASYLRALQSAERDGIHRLFRDTCRECNDFASRPAPDRAKAAAEEARNFLGDWAGSLSQTGAKADAQQFANDLMEQCWKKHRLIEDLYKEFDAQNRGRFFSAVGSDTASALMVRASWTSRQGTLADYRVLETLAEQRKRVASGFDVDLKRAYAALYDTARAREVPEELASRKADLLSQIMASATDTDARLKASYVVYDALLEKIATYVQRAEFTELFQRTELERTIHP